MKSSLLAFAIALSLSASAAERWTDAVRPAASHAPRGPAHVTAPAGGTLRVFDDIDVFATAVGDIDALALETFDGGATAAGEVGECTGLVNENSDDDCFAPGDLIGGFEIGSLGGVVVLGPQFLGTNQATAVIGAAEFLDNTNVAIYPPAHAVSVDVYAGGAGDVEIEALDETNVSLGTATAATTGADQAVFVGLVSTTPIARIVITSVNNGGETIDNLRFGDALNLGGGDTLLYSGFDSAPVPPEVALSFKPATIAAGEISTLKLTLSNANPTPAVLLDDLVDTLPAGLAIADPSNIATTCLDATAEAETDAVTLPVGARIPLFGECTVTIDVTSDTAATYTNTLGAGALVTNVGDSETEAGADLVVVDAACSPVQLLADTGIEATDTSQGFPYVNASWNSTSTNFGTTFCDVAGCSDGGGTAGPHGGTFWAWLGGAGQAETATLEQDVVIPAGSSRFLNFWLWIGAVGDASSSLDVAIDNQNVATFDEPSQAEAGYTQRSADVSAFADGNSHTVTFTYTSTGALSNYSLDDVTLECVAAPSMPVMPAATEKPPSEKARRKH